MTAPRLIFHRHGAPNFAFWPCPGNPVIAVALWERKRAAAVVRRSSPCKELDAMNWNSKIALLSTAMLMTAGIANAALAAGKQVRG